MNLAAFYVLISRVTTADSLRLLQYDKEGLDAVCALKHDEYLAAWECAYSNGIWSDKLAVAALGRVRRERKEAKAARAAAKAEREAKKAKAAREAKKAAASAVRPCTCRNAGSS